MARLYATRPGVLRIYTGRTPTPDGQKAKGGSCVGAILIFSVVFGCFITALGRLSPDLREFFMREGHNPDWIGLPLVVPAAMMLFFSARRVYLEFRQDSCQVVSRGYFTRTVKGSFSDFEDVRMETTEGQKGGPFYLYILTWKNKPYRLPLALSPVVQSERQLELYRTETVPQVRDMLVASAGAPEAAPAFVAPAAPPKPFFYFEDGAWIRKYRYGTPICVLLAAGLAALAVPDFFGWWTRIGLAAGALFSVFLAGMGNSRLRIDPERRAVTVHSAFGLRKREYPFDGFGLFYSFYPFNMVEVRLQPVHPPGPCVDVGSFFSFKRAKETAEETAKLMGIDLQQSTE